MSAGELRSHSVSASEPSDGFHRVASRLSSGKANGSADRGLDTLQSEVPADFAPPPLTEAELLRELCGDMYIDASEVEDRVRP